MKTKQIILIISVVILLGILINYSMWKKSCSKNPNNAGSICTIDGYAKDIKNYFTSKK